MLLLYLSICEFQGSEFSLLLLNVCWCYMLTYDPLDGFSFMAASKVLGEETANGATAASGAGAAAGGKSAR